MLYKKGSRVKVIASQGYPEFLNQTGTIIKIDKVYNWSPYMLKFDDEKIEALHQETSGLWWRDDLLAPYID